MLETIKSLMHGGPIATLVGLLFAASAFLFGAAVAPGDPAGTPPPDPATPGGEGDPPAQPEQPFLTVNPRTVYKTQDEAVRGIGELQGRVTTYSKFGSPEEIAGRLSRLETLERMVGGKDPGAPDKPKSKWTPQEREAHREWLENAKAEFGLMTREEYQKEQESAQQARAQELGDLANAEGERWIKDKKLEVTDEEIQEALDFGGALLNTSNRLNRMYFVEGKVKEVVDEILTKFFGAKIKPKEEPPPADPAEAQRRAAVAAGSDKIKKLPSPPPKGSGPGVKPAEKLNLLDPAVRKRESMRILEERGVSLTG